MKELSQRPRLLLFDIDGVLLYTTGTLTGQITETAKRLQGVLDQFHKWDVEGHKIFLLTGRKESAREETIQQLKSVGLFWDQLIMGAGGGQRFLFNDLKPTNDAPTAIAINLVRNEGLADIDLDEQVELQRKAMKCSK